MNSKAIRKQLLAAVAMVLVAAVALGSSTYAWFAAQNEVTAKGMQLQVQGETGIVIKSADREDEGNKFATIASANMTESAKLRPTSTYDLVDWYHAVSDEKDSEKSQQDIGNYENVTTSMDAYVLKKSFRIRSAAESVPVSNVKLAVKSVTVTGGTGSENLNKSIRVGIKLANGGTGTGGVSNEYWVYAPLADSNFTLTANYKLDAGSNPSTLVEKKTADAAADVFLLADSKVPASDTGLTADIYMWFEGEDANCKSTNITETLDDLNVTVVFTTLPTAKVDLTTGITVATSATPAKAPGAADDADNTNYYLITGKTGTNGELLYSSTSGSVTASSTIVTIANGKATAYTNVTLPS